MLIKVLVHSLSFEGYCYEWDMKTKILLLNRFIKRDFSQSLNLTKVTFSRWIKLTSLCVIYSTTSLLQGERKGIAIRFYQRCSASRPLTAWINLVCWNLPINSWGDVWHSICNKYCCLIASFHVHLLSSYTHQTIFTPLSVQQCGTTELQVSCCPKPQSNHLPQADLLS